MSADRPGQKQLHAWVSIELKTRLELWSKQHETTYTKIITEALNRHFEEITDDDKINARIAHIEQDIGRVLEILEHKNIENKQLKPDETAKSVDSNAADTTLRPRKNAPSLRKITRNSAVKRPNKSNEPR